MTTQATRQKGARRRRLHPHDVLHGRPQHVTWRLDLQPDTGIRGLLRPSGRRHGRWHLMNYISAGGMRDLQPARHADVEQRRRYWVTGVAFSVLAVWLLFRFLPCA